jgi:hypothetical protein
MATKEKAADESACEDEKPAEVGCAGYTVGPGVSTEIFAPRAATGGMTSLRRPPTFIDMMPSS